MENPVFDSTPAFAEVLLDEIDDPIVTLRVNTDLGPYVIHDFVTWSDVNLHNAGCLTIYDARTAIPIAAYAPGAWQSVEVLRVYRRGDDPPEAET